ncbi:MAG: aspartate carbamoyltransferase catalytic subunit [Fibrobacterales bacterium]
MSQLSIKHLIGLNGVPKEDLRSILDTAQSFREVLERPVKKVPSLRGVTVLNLFFENSTRTKISFELAEKRLSADVVNFSTSSSSLKKGETLLDTVRNIESMKTNVIVVRHTGTGVPSFLAESTNSIIVNAGDGANEHPTQALLDMLTMEQHIGSLEGKRVAIVGDIKHSRVARSNAFGLKTMGAEVVFCAPQTLMPNNMGLVGAECTSDLEHAIKGSDVVMALRLQKERQAGGYLPSEIEYRTQFGITPERIRDWNPDTLIMHPGPVNRNLEMDSDIVDSERSVILDQVTNGVAARMAVLYLLAGGGEE